MHHSIMKEFAKVLSQKSSKTFHSGSVWERKCNFGPLYSQKAFEKINAQMDDALKNGGKVYGHDQSDGVNGESKKSDSLGPYFYPLKIIASATKDMLFMKQETFGPLAFLVPSDTDGK